MAAIYDALLGKIRIKDTKASYFEIIDDNGHVWKLDVDDTGHLTTEDVTPIIAPGKPIGLLLSLTYS